MGRDAPCKPLFWCSRSGYPLEIVMKTVALITVIALGLIGNFAVTYAALVTFGSLNVALYSAAVVLAFSLWVKSCSHGE